MSGYAFYGSYRDNTSSSEACPVAYLKSRFEFIEGGTFWLSATPSVVGSKAWGNGIENSGYPRICTWALLRDKANGGVFCFAGTHLDLNAGLRLPHANNLSGGKVRIEVDKSVERVGRGRYVLTSGANLPNADSLEFMLPAWVERATVEDGEIVIYAKPAPFSLRIR